MQQSPSPGRLGTLAGAALLAAVLLWPVSAIAHHGWGGYGGEEFEITGTVTESVSTAGPHATLKVRVDGNVWNVVLAPPFRTTRAGLEDGMIPVGATVTAHGHRHRDANVYEIKTERVTWDGKVYAVYPNRD